MLLYGSNYMLLFYLSAMYRVWYFPKSILCICVACRHCEIKKGFALWTILYFSFKFFIPYLCNQIDKLTSMFASKLNVNSHLRGKLSVANIAKHFYIYFTMMMIYLYSTHLALTAPIHHIYYPNWYRDYAWTCNL